MDSRYPRGVTGAVLLFLGLTVLASLAVRPLRQPDESAHVAYAIAVAHGTIPRIDEKARPSIPGQRGTNVYTANHPPLYYVLVAGPLLAGINTGHPLLGLHLARLESVAFSAATVALTAVLAGLLVRRRPEVAVAAAAIFATVGTFIVTSAQVYNDSLATLLSIAVLLATLNVIRSGLRTGSCLLLVLTAAAAVATRISNAEVAVIAAIGLIVTGVRERAIRRGVAWTAALAAGCLASSGWFYLLNQARYGHLTGRGETSQQPRDVLSFLFSPGSYAGIVRGSYGTLYADRVFAWSNPLTVAGLLVIWGLAGLGLLYRLRKPPTVSAGSALVAAHCLACLGYLAWWVHLGGAPSLRYVLPAVPVLAVALAALLLGLPGGRVWAGLAVTGQVVLALCLIARLAGRWTGAGFWNVFPAALGRAGIPQPTLVTVLLLLAVACGWLLCLRAFLDIANGHPEAAAGGRAAKIATCEVARD